MQAFFNFVKRQPIIKIGNKYYKPYDKYGSENTKATITNYSYVTLGSTTYDLLYEGLDLTPAGFFGDHDVILGTPGAETFKLEWSYNRHALGLREIHTKCKAKIPISTPVLKDAPYHMFAIPFSDDLALYEGDTLKCVTNKSVAINAAQKLAQQAGSGVIYDIQLLPYCPVRNIIKTNKITAHAEFPVAEEQDIGMYLDPVVPGTPGLYISEPYFKLNTKYVISKDINWVYETTRRTYNQFGFGLKSQGSIYVTIGEGDLENPTITYQCKRIELIKPNNITTEDPKIRLYNMAEPTESDLPFIEISYNGYAASNTLIGIYLTSDFEQGGYGETVMQGISWLWYSNTHPVLSLAGGTRNNPRS